MRNKEVENNNFIYGNINGESIMIPYDDTKKIESIYKKRGKWFVKYYERKVLKE